MTTNETTYSKSQLAHILSALTEKRANPSSREAAMAAIERAAAKFGVTTDEVYAAADGLLDGRIPDHDFRNVLVGYVPTDELAEEPAGEPEAATDEAVEAELEIVDDGSELETFDHPELETTEEPVETKTSPKQQLIDACKRVLAEYELEPDTSAMLRAAIERAETPGRRARAATTKEPRGQTKQQAMVEMLKREEGATVAEMAEAMGWQAHTVRGAMAGALRKKLGLNVTSSGKVEGRGRVYHIEPQPAE